MALLYSTARRPAIPSDCRKASERIALRCGIGLGHRASLSHRNKILQARPMLNKPELQSEKPAEKRESVVIKKYANRRLYNTETSTYVTLEDLANMVRADKDFVVYDAKSGDDLTHTVLTQIIVEQESRPGQTLLPIPFLRQLIRFYDDSIGRLVPTYLQFSLENLVKEQEKFRTLFANAFTNPAAAFELYHEQTRKNMQMFEQAMSMWTNFGAAAQSRKPGAPEPMREAPLGRAAAAADAQRPDLARDELNTLKVQLADMQQKLERLTRD
jgi:polyhydroxyalkanoate synthesis repressor PhaR